MEDAGEVANVFNTVMVGSGKGEGAGLRIAQYIREVRRNFHVTSTPKAILPSATLLLPTSPPPFFLTL